MSKPANRAALAVALCCAVLSGCAPAVVQSPPATSTTTAPSGDTVSETPIRIVVGDQTIKGRLTDNPGARSLLDQLPVTIDFSDYGRQEVTGAPPQPITMDGMPSGESAPAGTIGYYSPGGVIVLYYASVGHYSGIVRLGTMDGDYSILEGWSSARPVTIELAD